MEERSWRQGEGECELHSRKRKRMKSRNEKLRLRGKCTKEKLKKRILFTGRIMANKKLSLEF